MGLIKDARPDQYDGLFGSLPNGHDFVARLRRLYADQKMVEGGTIITVNKEGDFFLYVLPLKRNAIFADKAVSLARDDITQRAALLRELGEEEKADVLERLEYRVGDPEKDKSPDQEGLAAFALEYLEDALRGTQRIKEPWFDCLDEACYCIACSFAMRDWLTLPWYDLSVDLEPAYALWRGGFSYEVSGNVCYVSQGARRDF